MSETAPALHCESLSVHTRNQQLLNNINFQINPGTIVGLIGANGAGKSTLLKAIVGLIPGVTGNCQVFGDDFQKPMTRKLLSFLPERFQVAGAFTGRNFLNIMNSSVADDLLCQHFDFASSWLKNPIKTYSKGMLQKLGLLYLFSSQKPLLMADELMSGLDMKTREAVYAHLHTLRQQGRTIFFSTHLTYDLHDLCDKVIKLEEGKVQRVIL